MAYKACSTLQQLLQKSAFVGRAGIGQFCAHLKNVMVIWLQDRNAQIFVGLYNLF